jgi:hypothetical protein
VIDHAALKVELDSDPTARGYAGTQDAEAAALLNEVQSGLTINRTTASTQEIREAVEVGDWTGLTDAQRFAMMFLTGGGALNPNHANVIAAFQAIFAATNTLTNLAALQTRDGSRAEELWGDGVVIKHQDVAIARAI